MWAISFGNPIDGFKFIGPFANPDDASDYASEAREIDESWWLVELILPQ